MPGARVLWQAEGDVASGRYSRAHRWVFDGGVEVPASASPDIVPLPLSVAAAVDPEEAFVAAVASCHMLWFLDLARREGHAPARYEDAATARMESRPDGTVWIAEVTLRPSVTWSRPRPDAAAEAALHEEAHRRCFIANSVRSRIVVEAAGDRPA